VLQLSRLTKRFPARGGRRVHAISDVSLSVQAGEVPGLVGESGSGTSTIGMMAARLIEPTSSLDPSVRAGILHLPEELRRDLGVAMLVISHDLETLELVSDRILVLSLGRLVEDAPTPRLFEAPVHPPTQPLLSAALPADPTVPLGRHVLEIPSPLDLPPGCAFAGRCPRVTMAAGHGAACLRAADGSHRIAAS